MAQAQTKKKRQMTRKRDRLRGTPREVLGAAADGLSGCRHKYQLSAVSRQLSASMCLDSKPELTAGG